MTDVYDFMIDHVSPIANVLDVTNSGSAIFSTWLVNRSLSSMKDQLNRSNTKHFNNLTFG